MHKRKAKPRSKRNPRQAKHSHYRVRRAALQKLGFTSYGSYLESELWKKIRYRVLCRDSHTCACCGNLAITVHHVTYTLAVLAGEDDSQLISLCRPCHGAIEFDQHGKKRFNSVEIFKALQNQAKLHGKDVKFLQKFRPICRLCSKPVYKGLGRLGICTKCHRKHRETVHTEAFLRELDLLDRAG